VTKPKKREPKRKRRWLAAALGGGALAIALALWGFALYWAAPSNVQSDLSLRVVNDITQLNPIQVGRVATPTSVEQLAQLLRESTGPVSIGGARCSMGGQIGAEGSLHLDMRNMNKLVSLSAEERLVTVQTGMRWRDLQEQIDPHQLSIKIMQTYSTFSVGGTLSVNAHGRYMGQGPVVQSVRAIKLVLASGEVVQASRDENPELFWGAIGGYGALGVIAEATLELAPNEKVKRETETMDTVQYGQFFREHIRSDSDVIFHNADLHPPSFDTVRAVSWRRSDAPLTDEDRLISRDDVYNWTPFLINRVGLWPLGGALRKHIIEPLFYSADAVTWRNHEASYDVRELEPDSRTDTTYVLREYFVPIAQLDAFVPKMREVFDKHDVEVVNISIRYATADPGTLLAWARGETFAFVVYYRQGTTDKDIAKVRAWSRDAIDAVLSVGGTYYLPYQNHATPEQFLKAYPRAPELFALKARVDPQLRFQNAMWEQYGPQPHPQLTAALAKLDNYHKPEGQTLLTVPEWYLVFNPVEYARHLRAQRPSDQFSFVASVSEYWSLYKRVLRASHGVYPDNPEYLTMLRVIGVSTTVEYLIKAAYEGTLGKLARWTSDGAPSAEETLIAQAFSDYSEKIYDVPWYEFDFMHWLPRVWNETAFFGPNVIRRTERKLSFSVEFFAKALYAKLIGFAASSAYGAPEEQVLIAVSTDDAASLHLDPRVKLVQSFDDGTHILAIPRWGPFTDLVPKLAQRGVSFLELAGNDDVVLSVIKRKDAPVLRGLGQPLFESKLVSDASRSRSVLLAPVSRLAEILRALPEQGAQLEHIYDY
jgi:FAD/FMN-containing dehydrogenase